MAANEPKTRTWVVLMNRVPRGPYEAADIHALIERGLLRAMDLAYIPGPAKDPLEWKFLWQFPEFERRKQLPANTPASPDQPSARVRRDMTETEIRSEIFARLPKDIASADSEELLRKARSVSRITAADAERRLPERPENVPTVSVLLRRLLVPLVAVGIFVLILAPWRSRKPASPEPDENTVETSTRVEEIPASPTFSRELNRAAPTEALPQAKALPPSNAKTDAPVSPSNFESPAPASAEEEPASQPIDPLLQKTEEQKGIEDGSRQPQDPRDTERDSDSE